jgi:hypothetical protein
MPPPCCPACVAALNRLAEDNRDLHESNDWLSSANARLDSRVRELEFLEKELEVDE